MRRGVIAEANEQVSIALVLTMLKVDIPEDLGSRTSHKIRCPFGEIYHSDYGVSPAMRIYPDNNSAYCFSCTAYYTPVSLFARAQDLDWRTAAVHLLDRIGYKPLDLAAHWSTLQQYEPEPDKSHLAEALKTFCRRIEPNWTARQFEPDVAATLTRCLGLLDLIRSGEDALLWLERCKGVMAMRMNPEKVGTC